MVLKAVAALNQRRSQLPPIYAEPHPWYQGWYFDLRPEEELARSQRYGLTCSVLVLILQMTEGKDLAGLLRSAALTRLRRHDIAARLTANELAICLPHTSGARAQIVADRLGTILKEF